jgi:hypothetical protein
MTRLTQYRRPHDPFGGVAVSGVTSVVMHTGDAAMITGSLTTSSATASKWTIQGWEGESFTDGFQTAIAAADPGWHVIKLVTAQGYFSFDTIPDFCRILRTPSHSSTTIRLTVHVGP